MRVLIDRNIERNAVTHRSVISKKAVSWGGRRIKLPILERKHYPPRENEDFRLEQIPYLVTICLLAKQNRVKLYRSFELTMESLRQRSKDRGYAGINLLEGLSLHSVKPPTERMIVVGGRHGNVELTEDDQMRFFRSIKDSRYLEICMALGNSHIDDAFHYWTAEHAGLDGFLTMDNKFVKPLNAAIKQSRLRSSVAAMTPKMMCERLGEGPTDIQQLAQKLHPFR